MSSPEPIELRRAEADDADLIRRTLSLAVHWRDDNPPWETFDANPAYFEGWPRVDDLGVVAFRGIEFAGGAYVRRVDAADGTYGWVEDGLFELTIGVEPDHRRQGLGRLLLYALRARVLQAGVAGISLSVEPDNHAANLYRAAGFEVVLDRGTDLLMAWRH